MSLVQKYLPFASATTTLQASTYLLAVCLFSISFLVFLNSSVSFVITDLIGIKDGVGDIVGTLGFVDELVALFACPIWGIVSDRLGVRLVCVAGYTIVGIALVVFVQAKNVYPQLLLARMLFSIGGAATATMVTAILPSMTGGGGNRDIAPPLQQNAEPASCDAAQLRHSMTPSLDSDITITPQLYNSGRTRTVASPRNESSVGTVAATSSSSPPRLAGIVGVFTGCGALVALTVFLPLPAQFSHVKGVTQAQAVAHSFYVVGLVSILVAVFCFFGLRNIQGEEGKGWRLLLGRSEKNDSHRAAASTPSGGSFHKTSFLPYWRLILDSVKLGFNDAQIGLGYLGGFVARASSVGISLFIPLFINAYFIRNGFCHGSPNDPSPELKKECRAAYILAAELTGASQLIALLCAPTFGYLSDKYRRHNIPLAVASACGVIGYTAFARLKSPEASNKEGRGGSPAVFLIVALIGISQIGAIVCSLGLLGRGIVESEEGHADSDQNHPHRTYAQAARRATEESTPLIASNSSMTSRIQLKGSIAGVYSLSGGAAILLLTKLGGSLFDSLSTGAPFYMMAIFNGVLLLVCAGVGYFHDSG